jgi:hypothetical protein
MKKQHTQGPWTSRGLKIQAEGKEIAEIKMLDGEFGKYKASANTRLIAAAPEMYEALNDALGELGSMLDEVDDQFGRSGNETYLKIQSILAKIE